MVKIMAATTAAEWCGTPRIVYSFWDMRKQVLRDELQLGKNDSDEQMWQVSWSYEQTKEQQTIKEQSWEFVILQIPNTTVTFQLDFDEDGTCSCLEPFATLNSFPTEQQQQQHNNEPRVQYNHSYSHVINDEETASSDSNSRLSRDEARAALVLLYQKHVHPLKQIRLLANALVTSDEVGVVRGERSCSGNY